MVDAFNAQNDRFWVTNNDKISFDTNRASIELFPDNTKIVYPSISITFPSPIQGQAYYRNQFNFNETICETWATLLWQEWGPDEGYQDQTYTNGLVTTRNLPRILLGSVPAETTYINVQMYLNRTTSPPLFYGLDPVAVPFPQNAWMNLPGGSLTCELYGVYGVRYFDIRRYGNLIYLDRYMSFWNANTTLTPGNTPNNPNIDVNQSGWINTDYNSANYPAGGFPAMPSNYVLNYLMDRRGPDIDGNKRPNGTNACTRHAWRDMTSVFTGGLTITPGRHRT